MHKHKFIILFANRHLILSALICTACSTSGGDISYTQHLIDPDGVSVVANGPLPQQACDPLPVLDLEIIAVIGTDNGPDEQIISVANHANAALAMAHNAYLAYLERQPMELRIYDTGGRFLLQVGRKGEGPGEFQYPGTLTWIDGRGWTVSDPINRRFEIFNLDGTYLATKSFNNLPHLSSRGFGLQPHFTPDGDFWYLGLDQPTEDDTMIHALMFTRWTEMTTEEVFHFEQPLNVLRGEDRSLAYRHIYPVSTEVDGEGQLWLNHDLPYQIEVFEPEGSERWRIRREHELRDYSAEYRREIESQAGAFVGDRRLYPKLPPQQPAIAGMNWTGEEMWVFTEAWVDSPLVQIDVFDTRGVYQRAFLAPKGLRYASISDDHILFMRMNADDVPQLLYCRFAYVSESERN